MFGFSSPRGFSQDTSCVLVHGFLLGDLGNLLVSEIMLVNA